MIARRITASFLKIPKKARTALLASLVIPGSGQIYNREVLKGILLWLMAVGFSIWTFSCCSQYRTIYAAFVEQTGLADIARAQAQAMASDYRIPVFFYLLVVVYSAYDAYLVARQVIDLISRERAIREAERRDLRAHNSNISEGPPDDA